MSDTAISQQLAPPGEMALCLRSLSRITGLRP
jgi:hypothetical protein